VSKIFIGSTGCHYDAKDPPFNQEYIYATYLLERAESMGVYVVNSRNRCGMPMKNSLPHGFRSAARKHWLPESLQE